LKDWLANGWVTSHEANPQEIRELLGVIERDLKDCRTKGLSTDWRFAIAYNAALQTAVAALAANGYRASREAHHFRVIQSLVFTIDAESSFIKRFDAFRKKRNLSGYEIAGSISDKEADEIIDLAEELKKKVITWIKKNHPDLL
jgi:hypothetical protein